MRNRLDVEVLMKLSVPIFRLKRQARLLSREANIPLVKALDRLAHREGFRSWSRLVREASRQGRGERMLAQFGPGDLVLLAARPGHGKTMLGLELAKTAARDGRDAFFFSLEETEAGIARRLRDFGVADGGGRFAVDTSDEISADYIISRLQNLPSGALAVIDYLQLLDQPRSKPELSVQLRSLGDFAQGADATVIAISQIDRSFEGSGRDMPGLSDVRLPNPADLSHFSRMCFLHDGKLRIEAIAP